MNADDWTTTAIALLAELKKIRWAGVDCKPEKTALRATTIRESIDALIELLHNKPDEINPGDAAFLAWRTAIPGIVRSGFACEASAHELAIVHGARIGSELVQLANRKLRPTDDELVSIAPAILGDYIDPNGIEEIEAAIRLECSTAMAESMNSVPPQNKDSEEIPPLAIDRIDVEILEELARRNGFVAYVSDLTCCDRKTAGERLNRLAELKYVEHPTGKQKGWIITKIGMERLKNLPAL